MNGDLFSALWLKSAGCSFIMEKKAEGWVLAGLFDVLSGREISLFLPMDPVGFSLHWPCTVV